MFEWAGLDVEYDTLSLLPWLYSMWQVVCIHLRRPCVVSHNLQVGHSKIFT